MNKIFSARLDEGALDELERVTRKHGMTKRRFLEEAIHLRARELDRNEEQDVWAETLGTWKRSETPEATVEKARAAFRGAFERHRRKNRARVRR